MGKYYEISSFDEKDARKYTQNAKYSNIINKRHLSQLSRVYPEALRISSSNYETVSLWSNGFQLLALNFQTPGSFFIHFKS